MEGPALGLIPAYMLLRNTLNTMDDLLVVLVASLALLVGTGVIAVFKGSQIRDWLRNRESALKKARQANTDGSRPK